MTEERFECPRCRAVYRLVNEDHERDGRIPPDMVVPAEVRHVCPDGKRRYLRRVTVKLGAYDSASRESR